MRLQQNLDAIADATKKNQGMDVIIVSVSNPKQAEFWQRRLEDTRGQISNSNAKIYVVHEDWRGGAGNGLGTLYAWQKANAQALSQGDPDFFELLSQNKAIALYHTAGKGTRLAPLPGSEGNNKPAVKLPAPLKINGQDQPITILEAVIKQTSLFAPIRRGRLSVFWGDQIFIPSLPLNNPQHFAADIIGQILPPPIDSTLWQSRNLSAYGLLAIDATSGSAQQIEKIDFPTAQTLIKNNIIHTSGGIAVSLGSFGISAELLALLLQEFKTELQKQSIKLDTDPHFWMPLTLDLQTYQEMMHKKGISLVESSHHWYRLQPIIQKISHSSILGVLDVGTETLWWDFGTIEKYYTNCLKLIGLDFESQALRQFLGLQDAIDPYTQSIVIGPPPQSSTLRRSILYHSKAYHAHIQESILIHSSVPAVSLKQNLIYQAHLTAPPATQEVIAGAKDAENKPILMHTTLKNNGQQDWTIRLPKNPLSYEELSEINNYRLNLNST
jgi:hypothetical protein